jgi:hypothetical protein
MSLDIDRSRERLFDGVRRFKREVYPKRQVEYTQALSELCRRGHVSILLARRSPSAQQSLEFPAISRTEADGCQIGNVLQWPAGVTWPALLEKSQEIVLINKPYLGTSFVRWQKSRFNPASNRSL